MDSSPEVFTKEEGLRLLKAGQLNDAIKVLEKVRDKTDDAQICSFLGAAYSQKGDKVNAIHAFEESLRLNETPKAYYNLAVIYESVGRIDEAVREYRMAVELDPNYALAAEALTRLHNQFAADHPEPEAAVAAAQPTQSMPAGGPPPSQTQSFAGAPPQGPMVGQAAPLLADPFARPVSAPPTQADVIARQMAKEQAIADQRHSLMKNGIIYGAICGAIFFIISNVVFGMMLAAVGGRGFLWLAIWGCIGAAYGALVGLWIGYTSGGEGAGFQAGGVLGLLFGIGLGVICRSVSVVIVVGVVFGLISGVVGLIIGKMVDMSISD